MGFDRQFKTEHSAQRESLRGSAADWGSGISPGVVGLTSGQF
jgi:hypothetical protein